jgi:hypothetical protein
MIQPSFAKLAKLAKLAKFIRLTQLARVLKYGQTQLTPALKFCQT